MSAGSAGRVHGGDRLPWVEAAGRDNYQSLDAIGWQVHVYGAPQPALAAACVALGLPLQVFPWQGEYQRAGLAQNALYLLRPDTYVALADGTGTAEALTAYFSERRIEPAPMGRARTSVAPAGD